MTKNVLIVHGWLHSDEVFVRMRRDLKDLGCYVEMLTLHGIDTIDSVYTTGRLIEYYSSKVINKINSGEFDVIIAHGEGAAIVLNAIENGMANCTVVLIAPMGINNLFSKLSIPKVWLLPTKIRIIRKLPNKIKRLCIKIIGHKYTGSYAYFRQIEKALDKCDPAMVRMFLMELLKGDIPYVHTFRKIYLIECRFEKLVSLTNQVKYIERLGDSIVGYQMIDSWHSPMLTDHDELMHVLKRFLFNKA